MKIHTSPKLKIWRPIFLISTANDYRVVETVKDTIIDVFKGRGYWLEDLDADGFNDSVYYVMRKPESIGLPKPPATKEVHFQDGQTMGEYLKKMEK